MKRAQWIVFAVALVVRLIAANGIDKLPISRTPHYDSLEYLSWARQLASGDFTWPVAPPHGPGYPFFLAVVLAVFSGSLFAARIVQSILGALTCLAIARTGAKWFGDRAGLAAGALLALYAPLIWIDVSILAEGLLIFTLAVALWCAATTRSALLIGALVGFAAIVRPTALVFLPLFLVIGATTWRARAAMLAAVAAVIAPVTIANARTSHAFIPVQAFGGMNFYLGNSPFRDGLPSARPGAEWDRIEGDAARHGAVGPLEEDRWFMRKTRGEIASHPLQYLRLTAFKLVRTLQNDEIRDTHSFYFFASEVALLRWLIPFALLAGLAAAGAVIAGRRGFAALAYIALAVVACVALVVAARYRMPMVLGLALLGGVAIDRIIGPLRKAVPAIVGALVVAVLTLLWRHLPSHNVAEEYALTADSLMKEDHLGDAERAARTAIEADAKSALAWDTLGAVLAQAGKRGEAAPAFARAVALNPDFTRAHVHRGMFAAESMNWPAAAAEYRRATEIDPRDAVAAEGLARTLLRGSDLKGAAAAYERLLALQPDNADTHLQLARIDGVLNKPAEGLAHAQRAIAIGEPSGENWLLAANLATQAKQYAIAEDALQRATSLLGQAPQITFGWALLRFEEGRLDEAQRLIEDVERASPGIPEVEALRAQIARTAAK
jgi:tetratricopeptide (TPR) repeat protein